jgi:DNA polymerase-3 subunit delta
MKIAPNNIESFLKSMPTNISAVLVYGPDYGLIMERVDILSRQIVKDLQDPFTVSHLAYDAIKDQPQLLAETMASLSFTGQRRLIKVMSVTPTLSKELQSVLSNFTTHSFVILIAGDLAPASSARKFFETQPHLATIACYHDEPYVVRKLIEKYLIQRGFSYDEDVILFLENNIAGDRLIILSELEKLTIYMGEERHITLNEVLNLVADNVNNVLDELAQYIANRNHAKTHELLLRLVNSGMSLIPIIRSVARYFSRLQQVKFALSQNVNENDALAKLSPPLFFKAKPGFLQNLNNWSLNALQQMNEQLLDLELACKKTGTPVQVVCERLFLAIV